MSSPIISIVGPTASGKTALSISLAKHLNAEIVNLDAYQIYKEMDIGTAKPSVEEREGIRHHLIDVVDIHHEGNVSEFQNWARLAILSLQEKEIPVVCVGGSGLYVKAVFDDLRFPGTDSVVRAKYEKFLAEKGEAALHSLLEQKDPIAAAHIIPGNSRRVVRALEVIELTGEPFVAQLPQQTPVINATRIGLDLEKSSLHARIAKRTHKMFADGWAKEVESLEAKGLFQTLTASRALGYKEVSAFNHGELSEIEAIEQIVNATNRFSKRQMQWFRRDEYIQWFDTLDENILDKVLEII
ncbi:MAG: tRNA ((37)-N6)-dimethylallyltransferase MiaA [Actinomycetota bacterium]